MRLSAATVDSPIGEVSFARSEHGVCALGFSEGWAKLRSGLERRFGGVDFDHDSGGDVAAALRAYFAGEINALEGLATDLGGTDFQRKVWAGLLKIGAGSTLSYSEFAGRLGCAGSQRAVGNANGRNPVSLIVPCHRVIAAGGGLGGYGFGLERKAWLLEHEGAQLSARRK